MAGVILDQGLIDILGTALRNAASTWQTAKLKLFKNNITPTTASVVGDFTEATFTGYAAASFVSTDWSVATATAHVIESDGALKTFTITSGTQDIYGWYLTNSAGTSLFAAQRDPSAPVTLDAAAVNQLSILLKIQARDTSTP